MKSRCVFSFIVIFATCLAPYLSHSECSLAQYRVKGTINGTDSGPIKDAKVYVFFDDNENASLRVSSKATTGRLSRSPDVAISAANGEFEFVSFFNSFNKNVKGTDKCDKTPTLIEVFIVKDGYLVKRTIFREKQFMISGQGPRIVQLPRISIERDVPMP